MAEDPVMDCSNCFYWEEREDPETNGGFCTRFPPQPSAVIDSTGELEYLSLWPVTDQDEFCGEWTGATTSEGVLTNV